MDLANPVGHLLLIHMLLLDYILGHFCIDPSGKPKLSGRKDTIIGWTKGLAMSLPINFRPYIEWPLQYCEILSHQDGRYLLSP